MGSILQEIALRRDLIRELVLKDLKLRYARPLLGAFWIVLSPLLTVVVFYLVFFLFLKVNISEAPFVLYLMTAVFTWRFFQDALMCSATSLIDNKNLLREAGFPHYLLPLSIVLSNAVIFLPSFAILLISAFILNGCSYWIVFFPLILVIHFIITLGFSIMFSVFYVRFRDIKYILEFSLLILFYLTPVFYSIYSVKALFPPLLFKAYMYNPFTILLNLYRIVSLKGFYTILQGEINLAVSVIAAVVFAALVLLSGFYVYRKNRMSINDYLSY